MSSFSPGTAIYLASQMPLPVVSPASPLLSGCSAIATTAPTLQPLNNLIIATQINQLGVAIAGSALYGGNGWGIGDGLIVSPISGLTVQVSAGTAYMSGLVQTPAQSYTLPASTSLGFLWLLQNGSLYPTTTPSLPGGYNGLYIGNFTTSSTNITQIDFTGVCYLQNGRMVRVAGDRSIPSDLPAANCPIRTITQGGTWEWDGSLHRPQGQPVFSASISSTFTGSTATPSLDNGTFVLTPTGGNQDVVIPTHPTQDQVLNYINGASSGSYDLLIYNGATLIATLTNGQATPPLYRRGSGPIPAGPVTPI